MTLGYFQHNNEIQIQVNRNFSLLYDWFVDNELSINFREDKTKSIFFEKKVKNGSPLNIQYKIKQYLKVTYLGCILDKTLSRESMTTHVINKVNFRLRFLYGQYKF